jgi:decaprenylphospho-beta-D-erythro-pentofuranosid-2-ulose 2-reductase
MARPLESALIFGACSGVAQALGRRLAERGARLFLVARDPARLAAVAEDLRVRGAILCTTATADLDDLGLHAALLDSAAAALGRIDLVVIAQGALGDQAASELDGADAERVLRSNFIGPALLAQAAGRRLAAQRAGVLVGISSVAGDRGRQSNYVYGSAKGGFSIFLEGLRNRLHRDGVAVLTVKPGFIDTAMTAHLPKNRLYASPDAVAAIILRAAERGRDVVYAPGFWRLVMLVIRLMPEAIFKRLRL